MQQAPKPMISESSLGFAGTHTHTHTLLSAETRYEVFLKFISKPPSLSLSLHRHSAAKLIKINGSLAAGEKGGGGQGGKGGASTLHSVEMFFLKKNNKTNTTHPTISCNPSNATRGGGDHIYIYLSCPCDLIQMSIKESNLI